MKLRNKKTGKVYNVINGSIELSVGDRSAQHSGYYTSLAEINEDWEDYEEPKVFYVVDLDGEILPSDFEDKTIEKSKELGNYFETKEEAKEAVEKLKAWKRLKDKGFRFTLTPGVGSLDITPGKFQIEITAEMPEKWFCCDAVQEDLDDCFGGEE